MIGIVKSLIGGVNTGAIKKGASASTLYLADLVEYSGKGMAKGIGKSLTAGNTGRQILYGGRANILRGAAIGAAKYGGASIIDEVRDTKWAERQSGLVKAGLFLGSTGLKLSAARSVARGVVGSSLYAGGALTGDSGRFIASQQKLRNMLRHPYGTQQYLDARQAFKTSSAYDNAMYALGSAGQKGSIFNSLMFGTGKKGMLKRGLIAGSAIGATKFAGRTVARTAVGTGPTLWGAARGAAAVLMSPFRMAAGRPAFGQTGLHHVTSPMAGRAVMASRAGRKLQKWGVIGKYGEYPVATPLAAIGAGMGVFSSAMDHNRRARGEGLQRHNASGVNRMDWQGGVYMMNRSPAKNFDPAMTMRLNQFHSRRLK